MSRLPIRIRLTAAFAFAVAAVVAGAGLLIYTRLRADLDDVVHDALVKQERAIVASGSDGSLDPAAGSPTDPQDGFSQVVNRSGHVLASVGGHRGRVLNAGDLNAARNGPITFDRRVSGIDSETRVMVHAVGSGSIVVVGRSLEDRNEALSGLTRTFTIVGPLAITIASLLGFAIASAGFAPIEAMRRRASEISLDDADEELPLPRARDEVRRLGETLNRMLARMRTSYERERGFVADASHELRTPIAVIKAELDAALRSSDLGPGARPAVVAAIEESDSLAALAEDLLVMARVESAGEWIRVEPVAVAELLAEVRDRFVDRAREGGRAIRLSIAPQCPAEVRVDRARLRQALGNLVDNALRHGEGEVEVNCTAGEDEWVVTVSDAGSGFDSSVRARAFDRFARGDGARTYPGAGLGLPIVRAIAEAHGGGVEIEDAGRTAVRIRLPLDRHATSGPRAAGWAEVAQPPPD